MFRHSDTWFQCTDFWQLFFIKYIIQFIFRDCNAYNWNRSHLLHVEIFEGMLFLISCSKFCPDSHDTVYHLPKGETDSTTKHCRYNWHWPSRGSFLFSVQLPIIGLNICRWPVPYVKHLFATNLPSWHNWYHSHSPCSGRLSSLLHSWKQGSFLLTL